MLFQETISYNLSKGESVYVAFMDIRKAFDTVYIPGLLYKLYNLELSMKTFKLISDSYQNYECAALVAGCPGSWFKPQRGIHQGGPTVHATVSNFYQLLIKPASIRSIWCRDSKHRCHMPNFSGRYCSVCFTQTMVNRSLQIAYRYSAQWLFEFSAQKSVIVVWGKDTAPQSDVVIGSHKIPIQNVCKHMGIKLTGDRHSQKNIIQERVGLGRSALLAARGIGSHDIPVTSLTSLCHLL